MNGLAAPATPLPVILNEMIDAARRDGAPLVACDQPVRCRLGTYVLRPKTSFKVVNSRTRSVWACDLLRLDCPEAIGPVILKSESLAGADGELHGFPREAMFYSTLAGRIRIEDFCIPKLYAMHVPGDGSFQLFLEHLGGIGMIESLDDRCRAAHILGRFAGHCHRARLHECDWLPARTLTPHLHHIVAFDRLLARLPVGEDERAEILEGYRQLLDRLDDVNAAYARELPTLCHGDLYRGNLFAYGKGFAAIDWEQVNAGRIGDDLNMLAFRLRRDGEVEAERLEELLIDAYAAGVAPFVSGNPSVSIRRVYRLRSVVISLREADLHRRWATKAPDRTLRRRRMQLLVLNYRRMAQRARELAGQIG